MIIKLVYNNEIHLIKLQDPSLEQLKNHVLKLHPQINQNFILQYIDNENDQITISSDEDLIVLFENLNNQQVKVLVKPSTTWTCTGCTFENKDGEKCEACEVYKNQPQGVYPGYQPQYPPPPQMGPPPMGFPPMGPPPMGPPPMGPPPMGPPHMGHPQIGHPHMGHPLMGPFMQNQQMMFGNPHSMMHHQFGMMHHGPFGHHFHQRKAQFKALMKNPQFAQQKAQLRQLAKEVSKTIFTSLQQNNQNQQQQQNQNLYYQYWQWSQEDNERVARLSEVLQCTQEQAREYLLLFRHLTLDEIVLMFENTE